MKCDKKNMLLYAVTDRAWTKNQSLYEQVESALKGGVACVQLREKTLGEEEFLKEALEISVLCKKYKVPLFINDNVDIAIKCHADGIHVGQDDMKANQVREKVGNDMMIGVSVHSVEEALEAVKNGADCLGAGSVFSTSTKANVSSLSKETLRDICNAVDIPVIVHEEIPHELGILQIVIISEYVVITCNLFFDYKRVEDSSDVQSIS